MELTIQSLVAGSRWAVHEPGYAAKGHFADLNDALREIAIAAEAEILVTVRNDEGKAEFVMVVLPPYPPSE